MNNPCMTQQDPVEGRVARRQRYIRSALIRAAHKVMSEKGIDAATMLEIADHADVGAGTIYNYFKSKDDLAVAVLENMMYNLALRIEAATKAIQDPAQVYAFGIQTVLETATQDIHWKQLLSRSEVIAEALFRQMGPFATRDFRLASEAGRFPPNDGELIWRLSSYAIVGISLAITTSKVQEGKLREAAVQLLCLTGVGTETAKDLVSRSRPTLPPEE